MKRVLNLLFGTIVTSMITAASLFFLSQWNIDSLTQAQAARSAGLKI